MATLFFNDENSGDRNQNNGGFFCHRRDISCVLQEAIKALESTQRQVEASLAYHSENTNPVFN